MVVMDQHYGVRPSSVQNFSVPVAVNGNPTLVFKITSDPNFGTVWFPDQHKNIVTVSMPPLQTSQLPVRVSFQYEVDYDAVGASDDAMGFLTITSPPVPQNTTLVVPAGTTSLVTLNITDRDPLDRYAAQIVQAPSQGTLTPHGSANGKFLEGPIPFFGYDGSVNIQDFIVSTSYCDERMQTIYYTTDLADQGIVTGTTITGIAFKITKSPAHKLAAFRVAYASLDPSVVACTGTPFTTTVVYGPAYISQDTLPSNDWYTVVLDTPIVYDGKNLLVEWSRDDDRVTTNYQLSGQIETFYTYGIYRSQWFTGNNDNGMYPFVDHNAYYSQYYYLPNIRFQANTNVFAYAAPSVASGVLNTQFLYRLTSANFNTNTTYGLVPVIITNIPRCTNPIYLTWAIGGPAVSGVLSSYTQYSGPAAELTYVVAQQASKGTFTITNAATGAFTYTPSGVTTSTTDTFAFVAVGQSKYLSNIATITVRMSTPPTVSGQSLTTGTSGAISGTLTTGDANNDVVSAVLDTSPSLGSVSFSGIGVEHGSVLPLQPNNAQDYCIDKHCVLNVAFQAQKEQSLYRFNQLTEIGIMPGDFITRVAVHVASIPNALKYDGFRVGYALTSRTALYYPLETIPDECFASTIVYGPATLDFSGVNVGDWLYVTLDTPIPYTGGNLMIEFSHMSAFTGSYNRGGIYYKQNVDTLGRSIGGISYSGYQQGQLVQNVNVNIFNYLMDVRFVTAGSGFTYTPTKPVTGAFQTDTFRFHAFDGYLNSTTSATVSINVYNDVVLAPFALNLDPAGGASQSGVLPVSYPGNSMTSP